MAWQLRLSRHGAVLAHKVRCEVGSQGVQFRPTLLYAVHHWGLCSRFFKVLAEEIAKPLDPMELLYPKETPVFDKYDDLLPVELTRKGFAHGVLDVGKMVERVRQMCGMKPVEGIVAN